MAREKVSCSLTELPPAGLEGLGRGGVELLPAACWNSDPFGINEFRTSLGYYFYPFSYFVI